MTLVAGNLSIMYISYRLPKISPEMGNGWRYLIKLQETKNKLKCYCQVTHMLKIYITIN